jgi:hypothetical protein
MVFLATTFARAEDCSCPVVQCEPCQKRLVLGSQIKECAKSPAVVCQKIVCENVDNYFQCIAGAPPLYIPPVDPATRYTGPRYTPDSQPPEIDFTKLADVPGDKPAVKPAPAPQFDEAEKPVSVRQPASVETAPAVAADWMLVLSKLNGEVFHGKKHLGKNGSFRSAVTLQARKKSEVAARFGKDVVHLNMEKGSTLELTVQDEVMMVRQVTGDVQFKIEKSHDLFVADLGGWRFGKKSGSFKISRDGSSTFVSNQTDEAYLRRETLISHADVIKGVVTYKFDDGADLYSVVPSQGETKANYSLNDGSSIGAPRDVASSTAASSEAFCNAPEGQYEQCAWKCFGAAAEAKNCANPSTAAKCVRFTCAADGQWKLPTVVSEGECSLDRIHVGICH